MDDSRMRLLQGAPALLSAAQQLEREAGDRGSATVIAPSLDCIEQALLALSRACGDAGRSIVPPARAHETVSARYARAVEDWPGVAPSYEEQARLLASLDQAGAALCAAAKATARARDQVASKVGGPAAPDARALHAACADPDAVASGRLPAESTWRTRSVR